MINKFHNIEDTALFDLLVKYTQEYTAKLMDHQDLEGCKLVIEEIINELSERKKLPNKGIDSHIADIPGE